LLFVYSEYKSFGNKNNMETLMWLAVAGVVMVVGKKIGKYLWPEDWENNA